MKKPLRYVLFVVAGGLVLAQFFGPVRTNPASDPRLALQAQLEVPAAVQALVNRSCRDCHTNDTRWPWYSYLAPVSWLVIHDVNHGRSHLNFSEWGRLRPDDAEDLLEEICEVAEKGEMPLRTYLLLHPEARLRPADVDTLCRWSAAARRQLRQERERES
jgi:hypothetical protein